MTAPGPLTLRGVLLGGGRAGNDPSGRPTGPVDVELDEGLVVAVEPASGAPARLGASEIDLDGYTLLPAPAEPHTHLDKAFTAADVINPRGDLDGAVTAWAGHLTGLVDRDEAEEDIARRARRGALALLAHGATAVRTHVNVGPGIELTGLRAVLTVRDDLRALMDIQVVAMSAPPWTGTAGAANRARLAAAAEAGADLLGGPVHRDPDPAAAIQACLRLAAEAGLPVDLHMDETLDPAVTWLAELARVAAELPSVAVTASHCVSLSVQPDTDRETICDALAAAGIGVVTLPQTNLYLQGRDWRGAVPRGLTSVADLRAAGVTVAAGADNLQDPFNPVSRADPLETAALAVAAGHLTLADAYRAVSLDARAVLGLPAPSLQPGSPAELLAVRGTSLPEVIGGASEDRRVFHRGRLVADTRVTTRFG